MKKIILFVIAACIFASCAMSRYGSMSSSLMERLELVMSKEQVIEILGRGYTISENKIEDNIHKLILSYREFYKQDELYLFHFEDGKLVKWNREIINNLESIKNL